MPLLTTSEAIICCLGFTPRFPRLAGIWMLGVQIRPVLEGILSAATTCWRVIVIEMAFRNCCPIRGFRRVDEGLKALDFDFSVFFFFSALVSACRILLQSSESLPIGSFLYSVTAAQPPYVESAILVNLFLFFSLEMTAFNDVETGSCSSEMLSIMSCRSSIISLLNSCCNLWPFCLKVSTWIFGFYPAGSLSLFFLIWFWISWNLESK